MTRAYRPIADMVPHAGTMVLLDSIEQVDDHVITCLASSHRAAGNPLRRDAVLPAVCAAEYAAQAVAVHGALSGRNADGYLAALKDLRAHAERLDGGAADSLLRITARKVMADDRAMVYAFTVAEAGPDGPASDRLLVEGRLSIFLTPEDPP